MIFVKGLGVRETTFKTVGMLPPARGRWNVRVGGGHIVFVSEDPQVEPYIPLGNRVHPLVEWADNPGVKLVQPKEDERV